MAQFTISWDNTDLLANANAINQTIRYRIKSVGGAWTTTGFTPANPMAKSVVSALTPVLTNNVIYEFEQLTNCTQNGPIPNDDGIKLGIGFVCITPTVTFNETQSVAVVNLLNTDVTKVRFTLRRSGDNAIVFGPLVALRDTNAAQATASGLTPSTGYYWQIVLISSIAGQEVESSNVAYIGNVCGPYSFTTEEEETVPDLKWRALTTTCLKDAGFTVVKTITGLASPIKTWYDKSLNRVWVTDIDAPSGNIYWFNPDTATVAANMVYSAAVQQSQILNSYIDYEKRRIYMVGDNTGGMLVYNMDTDSLMPTVTFGTNGAFYRTVLFVAGDSIYCNTPTQIIIINRNTLTITTTKLISTITTPAHFNSGPFNLAKVGTKLYVVSNNAALGTVGVYNADLSGTPTEITLTGAAIFSGGNYHQNIFYDEESSLLYVSDTGSSRQYRIDPGTNTVVANRQLLNREGKNGVYASWHTNPSNGDLYFSYAGANSSVDTGQIKRMYLENRSNFSSFSNMYESFFFDRDISAVTDTPKIVGAATGGISVGGGSWATDGSITVLDNSVSGNNTGIEQILTLEQYDDAQVGDPSTGPTKSNMVGDVDYIPNRQNLDDCNITTSLACPSDIVTSYSGGTLRFELSISNAVRDNPNIDKIQVYAYNTGTASIEGGAFEYSNPAANYYSGSFTGLPGTNYTIQIRYLNSSNVVLATC